MSPRVYPLVRDLHLYLGLFLSPFVFVFTASVFFLVHSWVPGAQAPAKTRTVANVAFPPELERLKARELVDAAQRVLAQLDVHGEIGFVRQIPRERRIVLPVSVPGRETTVDLNLANGTATIVSRETGFWDAMVFLHKMPGPHNVAIRGNAGFIGAWRWLADATVYLLLFLTASGVYLWAVLKSERRVGVVLFLAGSLSLAALTFALVN
jgi:hypothetical protein